MALQVAIVAALKEFRDNLPTILPALVDEYITEVVTEPLFVEVRCVGTPCCCVSLNYDKTSLSGKHSLSPNLVKHGKIT